MFRVTDQHMKAPFEPISSLDNTIIPRGLGLSSFSCWLPAMSKPFHCAFLCWYSLTTETVWHWCPEDMKGPLWIMLLYLLFCLLPSPFDTAGGCSRNSNVKLYQATYYFNAIHKCNYSPISSCPNYGAVVISQFIYISTQSALLSAFGGCNCVAFSLDSLF